MLNRTLLPWLLGAAGAGVFVWVLWRIDYAAFFAALANASLPLAAMVAAAILVEQWVAAAKWKLVLGSLGKTRLSRVFGANMAAWVAGTVVPVAGAPVVRSFLVARCESLRFTSVLGSIAIDRVMDGAAFLAFTTAAILLIGVPQTAESLQAGLITASLTATAALAVAASLLVAFRHGFRDGRARTSRIIAWLPERRRERAQVFVQALAAGFAWPRSAPRFAAILALALCVKALGVTHLFWAGLALGVSLELSHYVLLMVLLGFVHLLARVIYIPGTYILAAAFLLELFGVDRERALAMPLVVQVSALVTFNGVGALALAWFGAELRELNALYAAKMTPESAEPRVPSG